MDAVSSLSPGAVGTATQDAFSTLNSEQFVKIIFTELSKQDPLQPNDSKALLEQLSSLRNIQSSMDLQSKLGSLVAQNELSAASGLIGKTISGISDDFERTQGVVQSVIRDSSGAVLSLSNGKFVHMSNLDQVLAGGNTGGTGAGGAATS
jgi:flagellar basal-body rod modification protein FlgD